MECVNCGNQFVARKQSIDRTSLFGKLKRHSTSPYKEKTILHLIMNVFYNKVLIVKWWILVNKTSTYHKNIYVTSQKYVIKLYNFITSRKSCHSVEMCKKCMYVTLLKPYDHGRFFEKHVKIQKQLFYCNFIY
jgi:hypothetical protein